MKRLVILLVTLSYASLVLAAPLLQPFILEVAESWLEMQSYHDYSVSNFDTESDSLSTPLLYKVNFSPSGYVIISADDRCYPILAYSESGTYATDNPAKLDLINQYKLAIQSIIGSDLSNALTLPKWTAIQTRTLGNTTKQVIPGFLSEWHQRSPYNDLCPKLEDYVNRSPVGCVATAFSQIINYWGKWRYTFSGEDDYSLEYVDADQSYNIPIIDNDFDIYDFPSFPMLNTYMNNVISSYSIGQELTNEELAALCFANGVLLKMKYNVNASGADTYTDGARAYRKLEYECTEAQRTEYSDDTDWENLICNSISSNWPIHYGAKYGPDLNGHSFIIYGFQNDSQSVLFAINWGWVSILNPQDWWSLSNLNPNYDVLNYAHQMVYGIHPNAQLVQTIQLSDNLDPSSVFVEVTNSDNNTIVGCFNPDSNGLLDGCIALDPRGKYDIRIYSDGYQTKIYSDLYLIPGENILDESTIVLERAFYLHGTVSCDVPQFDLSLVNVKLKNSANDLVVTTAVTDAEGRYALETIAGQYYIECELFQPSLMRYCYPRVTNDFILQGQVSEYSLPPINIRPYVLSNVRVSSDESLNLFNSIGDALDRIKQAVNDPSVDMAQVTLDILSGDYYWPYNSIYPQYIFDYTNANNSSLTLRIRGITNQTHIEPYGDYLDIIINRTNIQFQNLEFTRAMNPNTDYFLSFGEEGTSSYSFTGCTFSGDVTQPNLIKSNLSFTETSGISFYNCNFQNIDNRGGLGVLNITNCSNVNISETTFIDNVSRYGGAIHIEDTEDLIISNCQFEYNTTLADNESPEAAGTPGSAVFIINSQAIQIINNRFAYNHTTGEGGPLFLKYASEFSITDNEFIDNTVNRVGSVNDQSDSVGFMDCAFSTDKPFARNVIKSTISDYWTKHFIALNCNNTGQIQINNCTFVQGTDVISNEKKIFLSYGPVDAFFDNCVFDTGIQPASFYTGGSAQVNVKYSLFSSDSSVGVSTTDHVTFNVPDMGLDTNYVPIWNTTIKSPCIDNGNPDLNNDSDPWYVDCFDRDSDFTQMDIGANPLLDGHIQRKLNLTSSKVRYVSIPGLQNFEGSGNLNSLIYVFDENEGNGLLNNINPVLDQITWRYNDQDDYASPTHIPTHQVVSQYGYKVKLLPNTSDFMIEYSGYYPGSFMNLGMEVPELERYTTEHFLLPPDINDPNWEWIDSYTGVHFREVYLGYYLDESLKPFDALLPILDDITAIMAEDWAMARLPRPGYTLPPGAPPSDAYTDDWLGCLPSGGRELTINPGEMVVIRYIGTDPIEFKLGGENPDPPFTDPYYRELASHFNYEEQLEYIPVFVSIDLNQFENGDKPTEIAIFVDEECKGAAIIKEGEVQLNAYITNITDPSEELKDLEFRMYFPNKAASTNVLNYSILNPQSGRFEGRKVKLGECKEFLQVFIGETETPPLPLTTKLYQNYPNPFNPETLIKYDLKEDSRVVISIYNLKGQKVRSLVSGIKNAGSYQEMWNGEDDNGSQVSSGVYFYRMQVGKQTLMNKMLLLK